MEYKVRIITTKRGYDHLIKVLRKSFKSEKIIKDLINEDTCEFYGKNVVFIKWDNPPYHKIIQTVIMFLTGYRNAYRICVKEGKMVYMYTDEAMPRQHIDIPMPVMNCEFDDEETIKRLNKFKNKRKKGGDTNGI